MQCLKINPLEKFLHVILKMHFITFEKKIIVIASHLYFVLNF